ETAAGLTRLFAITEHRELRSQVRWLPDSNRCKMLLQAMLPGDQFESAIIDAIARNAFVDRGTMKLDLFRDKRIFQQRREERGRRIAGATQDVAGWLSSMADAYHEARKAMESTGGGHFAPVLEDLKMQIRRLTPDGFMAKTPWLWLQHYPRYFQAMAVRIDRAKSGGVERDQEQLRRVDACYDSWLDTLDEDLAASIADGNQVQRWSCLEVRWMLEELRVSMFAQGLGTSIKISETRILNKLGGRQPRASDEANIDNRPLPKLTLGQ
ncbi:MAG: DUF3418 domain-containing protein, partial [Planctomycetota bacterium]